MAQQLLGAIAAAGIAAAGAAMTAACSRAPAAAHAPPVAAGATGAGGSAAEALPPEATSTDEEAGVKHLHALLRCVDAGVAEGAFEAALDCLVHAERGVALANDLTRSHPDFDDTVDAIRAARPHYLSAVEQDRIARRDAAIAALEQRGTAACAAADALLGPDVAMPPTDGELTALGRSHAALAELVRAGATFADVPHYAKHAKVLRAGLARLCARQEARLWQQRTGERLGPPEEDIAQARRTLEGSGSAAEQLAAYNEMAGGEHVCLEVLRAAQGEPGYASSLVVPSRFGPAITAQLQARCEQGLSLANDRIARFSWDHLMAQLNVVWPHTHAQGRLAADAAAVALPLLARCAEASPDTEAEAPASSAKWTFQSPFGRLNVARLQRACSAEAKRLALRQATLAWQASVEALASRCATGQRALAVVAKGGEAAARKGVVLLGKAGGDFAECRDALMPLLNSPEVDRTFKVSVGPFRTDATGLLALCRQGAEKAQLQLQRARAAAATAAFRKDCHNDEVVSVDRNGMPTRVEPLGSGRVFVYEAGQRVAFDAGGQRTDEAALRLRSERGHAPP